MTTEARRQAASQASRLRPEESSQRRDPGAGLILAVALAGYIAVLHFGFKVIASTGEYRGGFDYRSPELLPYLLSIAIVFVLAWAMPMQFKHTSHFILWILYLGAVAPIVLAGNYIDVVPVEESFRLGVHISLCLLIARVGVEIRPAMHLSGTFRDLSKLFPAACLAFSIGIVAYLGFQGTLSFRLLSIYDVYDVRSEFQLAGSGDPVIGYLVPVQFYVIGPTVIALGLFRKRWEWAAIGVVSQLILYATVGHKTVLFSVFGIFGVFALLRNSRRAASRLLVMITTLAVLSVLLDIATRGALFTEIIMRRFLLTPAVLAQDYLEIFGSGPKTNFAEVLPIGDNPYGKPPSLVVGDLIFGGGVNADASLWMHGYASYGLLGMYGVTLLLIPLLWVIDDCTSRTPLPLACSMFLMPAVAIGEASLFTALLSHGLLVAIACAFLLPRDERAPSPGGT